jgi:chromosome segregation ATPase
LEDSLAKETQHAAFAQELLELKTTLNDIKSRYHACEKELDAHQFKLQQLQTEHKKLVSRHEKLLVKSQEVEHGLIQSLAQQEASQKHTEQMARTLSKEQHLAQLLNQQVAVFTSKLQSAQEDLSLAEDKIATLRQEKMFLVQEKAQWEGAYKQLQSTANV